MIIPSNWLMVAAALSAVIVGAFVFFYGIHHNKPMAAAAGVVCYFGALIAVVMVIPTILP